MAVANYEPIDLVGCPDFDFGTLAYRSLNALEQAAKDGGGDVECVHISGSISGDTTTGESCAQLVAPTDMPEQLINNDQICCLIINVAGVMENPIVFQGSSGGAFGSGAPTSAFYYPYAGIATSVKCSGQTISTDEGRGSGVISVMIDPTTCDFSNGLEFCVRGYTDNPQASAYHISWCGCLLCVQCPPLPFENYYIPQRRDPNCAFGLGDFAQIIHILNQLSAAFRCTGYTVDCVVREDVSFNALIDGPVLNDSKWIGIACTRATWSGVPAGSVVRVNTSMGCESRTVPCNSSSFRPTVTQQQEAEFISIGCGECLQGESIYFNSVPEVNCAAVSEEEEEQTGPGFVQADSVSEMVFFVFRKLENDLPDIPQVSSMCVFQDNADAILAASEAIHEAACEIQKPNKQSIPFTASGLGGEHTEIVPPTPWPPPTPPPRPVPDPPPVKKWVVLGSAQAKVLINNVTQFDPQNTWASRFNYEIKCGGAPVHTSPWYEWPVVINWNTFPLSYRIPICAIVDCPIDQNIEICMNFEHFGNPAAIGGSSSGMALCIS